VFLLEGFEELGGAGSRISLDKPVELLSDLDHVDRSCLRADGAVLAAVDIEVGEQLDG
jgi:hypothetical protein